MIQSVQTSEWHRNRRGYRVTAFLSQVEKSAFEGLGREVGGVELETTLLDPGLPIPPGHLKSVDALIVEIRCDQAGAMDRLQKLIASAGGRPVLAAVRDPSLTDVRRLMRTGASDVLPLPLAGTELNLVLERLVGELEQRGGGSGPSGAVITAIKSRGGVGASTILSQLACLAALQDKGENGACLLDMDLQFGNVALYLGRLPKMSVKDLLDAGSRLDGSLLRATLSRHSSGLHYIGAPIEMLPLEAVTPEDSLAILDVVRREFGTVFVDLPHDWTEWSFQLLSQSSTILLVSDLTIPGLHQCKRQLDFLRQQDLGEIPVQIVMNKVPRGLFKSVSFADAETTLGREVSFSIAQDDDTLRKALDQGELVSHVDPRGRTTRDIALLSKSLQALAAAVK